MSVGGGGGTGVSVGGGGGGCVGGGSVGGGGGGCVGGTGVAVGGTGVAVAAGRGRAVAVAVGVRLGVRVGVLAGVLVGVCVAVAVGDGEGDGVTISSTSTGATMAVAVSAIGGVAVEPPPILLPAITTPTTRASTASPPNAQIHTGTRFCAGTDFAAGSAAGAGVGTGATPGTGVITSPGFLTVVASTDETATSGRAGIPSTASPANAHSNAFTKPLTVAYRSPGSFANAFASTPSTPAGRTSASSVEPSGRAWRMGGGGSCATLYISASVLSAWKGTRPPIIS